MLRETRRGREKGFSNLYRMRLGDDGSGLYEGGEGEKGR